MLMVIFGAGASSDSSTTAETIAGPLVHPPPLAHGLFDIYGRTDFGNIAARYAGCSDLIARLTPEMLGTESVEAVLDRYWEQVDRYPGRRRQLLALRFYIRDAIAKSASEWEAATHNATNYGWLVDEVAYMQASGDVGEVCFVTFNYDVMLDGALRRVLQVPMDDLNPQITETLQYFKVHGSVDRVRPVAYPDSVGTGDAPRWVLENAEKNGVLSDIIPESRSFDPFARPHLPAIAVPFRTKTTFELPAGQLEELRKQLKRVTKVIVIGWAGADAHFVAEMAAAGVSPSDCLIVVGQLADAAVQVNERLPFAGCCWFKGGFRELMTREGLEAFRRFAQNDAGSGLPPRVHRF